MDDEVVIRGLAGRRLGDYVLPRAFDVGYTASDGLSVTLFVDVTENGIVNCRELLIRSPGPMLGGHVRRVPVAELLDKAVEKVATIPVASAISDGTVRVTGFGRNPAKPRGAVAEANRRRRRVNNTSLERVAEIVQAHPKQPNERDDALASSAAYHAICAEFKVGERAAQLWVKRSRDGGFLR